MVTYVISDEIVVDRHGKEKTEAAHDSPGEAAPHGGQSISGLSGRVGHSAWGRRGQLAVRRTVIAKTGRPSA
jgi:hypothetical protein